MVNPKVSIIIPVYNGEKTIKECLDSIFNQNYKNYELILIDNNSTDKTRAIIQNLKKRNKKIKYVFEAERGAGAARNKGERMAKGEIILMTDIDCIVPKDWIKNMTAPIINKECDAVQGSEEPIISFNSFLKPIEETFKREFENEVTKRMKNIEKSSVGRIDTKNFAISIKALKNMGFTTNRYIIGHDTELSIRFQKKKLKLKFLKHTRVKHFYPSSSREIMNKHFYRAAFCSVITKENKDFLKKTDFLNQTQQTPWSFMKIFPGLLRTGLRTEMTYTYFDFIRGSSWRAGLVYGNIVSNKYLKRRFYTHNNE